MPGEASKKSLDSSKQNQKSMKSLATLPQGAKSQSPKVEATKAGDLGKKRDDPVVKSTSNAGKLNQTSEEDEKYTS